MPEDEKPEDKAAASAGANTGDLSESTEGGAPKEPELEQPPVKEPETTEEAKEEETKEPEAKEPETAEETSEEDWATTGDEVGDSVLDLLKESGLDQEKAKALMYDAVKSGDVTKIDRAALEEAVGKAKATLIMAGTENFVQRSQDKAQSILKNVYDAVGGEDNWKSISTWAKENVSESDLADYRDMIDAGGAKSRFAAQEIRGLYNADSNNTSVGEAEITPDNKPPTGGRAIDRITYVKELDKAYSKGASASVIQEIQSARERGRNKGI